MGAHSIQPPLGSGPNGQASSEGDSIAVLSGSTGDRCFQYLLGHLPYLHRTARRGASRLLSAKCTAVEGSREPAFHLIAEFTSDHAEAEGKTPYFAIGVNPDGSAEYTDLRFAETDVLGQREY